MRNLKRVLSLALALVMVLGMMVIGTSAADFTDADEITYTEAMDVMAGLGVFKGNPDGSVAPTQVLTRKEAAVIIARIILGEKMAESLAPTKQIFDDVATTEWYAAEVEYCNNIDMIVGHNGKFNPDGELTGTAFAKLLLCAMGYDAAAQGYEGKDWDTNINADAIRAELNIKGVALNAPLTREGAAQMLYNALESEMVEYTVAYDYATGAQIKVGPNVVTKTVGTGRAAKQVPVLFMNEYFKGLAKVEGVIMDTNADKGTTTVGTTVLKGTDADWTNVGYAARAWALNGKALSVVVTGSDLSVTTNGTDMLGAYGLVDDDTNPYNPNYVADLDTNVVYVVDGNVVNAPITTAKIGDKLALVNNDNDPYIDAVVKTTYTADKVKKVNLVSYSGTILTNSYNLSNSTVSAKYVVCADELTKNDYIAYTVVDGYYYVTVLEAAMGEYEYKTTTKLNGGTVYNYNIAGVDYIVSENSDKLDKDALNRSYINSDIIYVTDMYGYIVAAVEYSDPDAFLFVLGNEHNMALTGLADTEVAYIDGSVEIVGVKGTTTANSLKNAIYSYTVKNGAYSLTKVSTNYYEGDYTNNTVKMGRNLWVTEDTVIVDLRDVVKGKADAGTVYTGYAEIPSVYGAKIYTLEDQYNNVVLGFMVSGTDASGAYENFFVFNTEMTVVDEDNGEFTYALVAGVIMEGETEATPITLNETQKAIIEELGVGKYRFTHKNGETYLYDYTSFAEDSVRWTPYNAGTVIYYNEVMSDYTPVILDIAYGEINYWYQYVEAGWYKAYVDHYDDIIYIAVGEVAGDEEDANPVEMDGNLYYAADGYITGVEKKAAESTVPNYLREVEINGVKGVYAGGAGTQAAPYKYVATDCFQAAQAEDKASLKVVAQYTDNKINVFDGAYTAEGVLNTIKGWEFNANNKFTFTIDGTYYEATIVVLKHDVTLTPVDATKVYAANGVIYIASSVADEADPETAVQTALETYFETDATIVYDAETGKVTVTAECGNSATYTVDFEVGPFEQP